MQESGEANEVFEGYEHGVIKGNGVIMFKRVPAEPTLIYVFKDGITAR